MTARGASGGAATIVNAMATRRGAAFGLAWGTRATVRAASTWSVYAQGRRLAALPARLAIESAKLAAGSEADGLRLRIDVKSQIPAERGLKSSSAASIAVMRAVLGHLGRRWTDLRILRACAEAGLASGTSLTGAFDDAAACLLGQVQVTDNAARRVIRTHRLPPRLHALVHVPRRRIPTRELTRVDFRPIRPAVEEAWYQARKGRIPDAMYLNTAAYANLLRLPTTFTVAAVDAGAWAAGLSGKGPAEVALVDATASRRLVKRYPNARRVHLAHGRTA